MNPFSFIFFKDKYFSITLKREQMMAELRVHLLFGRLYRSVINDLNDKTVRRCSPAKISRKSV